MRNIGIGLSIALVLALAFVILRAEDGDATNRTGRTSPASIDKATRILPGSAASADWLAEMVDPERIVALPEQVAKWSGIRLDPEPWKDHPRFAAFTSETVMSFDPDLIFVSPWTDQAMVKRVREAGFRVVTSKEPTTWDELIAAGRDVAAAVDEVERGEAVALSLEARKAALAASKLDRPLVVLPYSNSGSGGYTSGKNTTLDLALTLAGHRNAAAEHGLDGPVSITDEIILGLEFDALLVSGSDDNSTTVSIVGGKDALATLPAVQADAYIVMNSALYASGSHTIMDAAELIAARAKEIAESATND